ncbi:hypothetical protein A8C56_10140 [Niabella ginsenosidivorans]|uniref:Uncharacterized protein n=1 Tax=Niabella ginsenosidivorans TaxID=1176587 RepID=A0A1A9I3Z2_9BACT|nr:hypothetical protein A8C56_10140 [Niabella ginsenosidivorans]
MGYYFAEWTKAKLYLVIRPELRPFRRILLTWFYMTEQLNTDSCISGMTFFEPVNSRVFILLFK